MSDSIRYNLSLLYIFKFAPSFMICWSAIMKLLRSVNVLHVEHSKKVSTFLQTMLVFLNVNKFTKYTLNLKVCEQYKVTCKYLY